MLPRMIFVRACTGVMPALWLATCMRMGLAIAGIAVLLGCSDNSPARTSAVRARRPNLHRCRHMRAAHRRHQRFSSDRQDRLPDQATAGWQPQSMLGPVGRARHPAACRELGAQPGARRRIVPPDSTARKVARLRGRRAERLSSHRKFFFFFFKKKKNFYPRYCLLTSMPYDWTWNAKFAANKVGLKGGGWLGSIGVAAVDDLDLGRDFGEFLPPSSTSIMGWL